MAKNYDVIIIGGGPAGVSAGIYALRAGLKILVVDNQSSSLEKASIIENYYGVQAISGKELKEAGQTQLKKLGGEVLFAEVVEVAQNFEDKTFTIKTTSDELVAKAIILAMGSARKRTISALQGKAFENVSYCAVCDGFFYRGRDVAVIGEGSFACHEAEYLNGVAGDVYLLTNGKLAENNVLSQKFNVVEGQIAEIKGGNIAKEIVFKDGKKIAIDGIFVAEGSLSSFEIAKQLGILTNSNAIVVQDNYMTNVDGVFAAGDIIGGLLQISKAVSDGAHAGLAVAKFVKNAK